MIAQERWNSFTKRDQLGHIASELARARLAPQGDKKLIENMVERAIYFIDLSLKDPKWLDNPLPMLVLRAELAKVFIGQADLERIYAIL